MAIYHLEAKVISRGTGRSAVAAAAYMSCSEIYNDYDGIQHDYTRKQGLVYSEIMLPENAPSEWADRGVLWNAVEEAEKSKDSRLAREFVLALPIELDREQQISVLKEFVQDNFVNDGMCADIAIHDTDGHNPHAHIMLTIRPLDDKGKWQPKTQKEYLCVKDGTEQGFTAEEFKAAQADGWEKQYQYFVGKKKVYLPPSQAEGLERVNKYPKSTKYGRQNPICERWNSEEQLELWRKNWADITNKYLEHLNLDSRIDHCSHAERGINEQPTIHEGVSARIMESKGFTSERREINRQIKADNTLLRELKAQLKKLIIAAKRTVSTIAKVLETLRKDMIYYRYTIDYADIWDLHKRGEMLALQTNVNDYDKVASELKTKIAECKELTKQRDNTPKIQIFKHRELTKVINGLSERIEELRTQKTMLLQRMDCGDDKEVGKVRTRISDIEKGMEIMQNHAKKCKDGLREALYDFADYKEESREFDYDELLQSRLAIRPQMEQEAKDEIVKVYVKAFVPSTFTDSIRIVDNTLEENLEFESRSLLRKLRRQQKEMPSRNPTPSHRKHEDEWDLEL